MNPQTNIQPVQYLDTQAAFALRAKQLVDVLYEQMAEALDVQGLEIISKTMGIVQLLYTEGPCSQSEIASRLRYSHQLAAQRLGWLLENGFAVAQRDRNDGRKRQIRLTDSGVIEAKKLQVFLPTLIEAYEGLFEEMGLNLDQAVQTARRALQKRSLLDRILDEGREKKEVSK